jgi:hypothetical protein
MSTERDVTRIVRSWLRTDEHDFPIEIVDDVLAHLDATPQDRLFWPARRFADMNTYTKLAIAAAAVLVVAFTITRLLPANGVGGPVPTPSPSAVPGPSAAAAAVFPPSGELAIGRHSITQEGMTYSFNIATSGWVSNGVFGIDKSAGGFGPTGAGFIFWTDTPVGIFTDPCAQTKGPALGTSIGDLAAAVAAVPGTKLVGGPTDVTVGGHPAKLVVVTIPDDIGCEPQTFYLWYAPSAGNARYATALGSTYRVWIIDVSGTPVWIDGETFKGAGAGPAQEIQAIVDSIQFE